MVADLHGAEEAAAAFAGRRRHHRGRRRRGDVERLVRGGRRALRGDRRAREQRRPLRVARDAPVRADPARGVAQVMDVNVASMFLMCRAVVPVMREPRRRQDREHLVGHAVPRRAVPAPLRDLEGRDRRVHARAREGGRQGRRPRQLRRAGLHDVGRRGGASGGGREAARRLGRRRARSSATRCRRTSSARSCSSAGRGSDFVTGQTIVIDGGQSFH